MVGGSETGGTDCSGGTGVHPLVLLSTADGRAYTGSGFRTIWQRATAKALQQGLAERFTFHDLRAKAGSESRDWKRLGHWVPNVRAGLQPAAASSAAKPIAPAYIAH